MNFVSFSTRPLNVSDRRGHRHSCHFLQGQLNAPTMTFYLRERPIVFVNNVAKEISPPFMSPFTQKQQCS